MFYDWIINNLGSLSDILLYLFIFYTILGLIYIKFGKDNIINNWDNYRCKPHILPISGFIKKEADKNAFQSTISNFNGCFWNTIKSYFNILIKPIVYILDILKSLLSNLTKGIDIVRSQIKVMRNMILGIVMGMMKKLENIMTAATFSYAKINEIMKRQLAVYQNMMYLMQSISVTTNGFVSGTMGKILDMSSWAAWVLPIFTLGPAGAFVPAIAFCFHPNTLINNVYIKDILLGNKINKNSIVISKMAFNLPNNTIVYNHKNTIVSGWHYVFEDNKWIKVCDSPHSIIVNLDSDILYTLNTSNNIININGINYRDYEEKNISEDANSLILQLLNNIDISTLNISATNKNNKRYRFGFAINTVYNNQFIQNVKLGDDILGVISHKFIGDEQFYLINNVICSEYVKILIDNVWINAREIGKLVNYTDTYYHVVTKDHCLTINDMIFRDFIEVDNYSHLEKLDQLYNS